MHVHDRMREEEYLMLSGIQHFAFCRRQWALIHIEQQWADNVRTVDGNLIHHNAHDDMKIEKRKDRIITRGMRVVSHRLCVSGICDVVEFHKSEDGVCLHGWPDLWKPYPIEYKRGAPKEHDADILQLCVQAICLEEMLCCEIEEGSLYYGETRRRQKVKFGQELREQAEKMLNEMHSLYTKGWTPKVKPSKSCNACSLKDICLPKLSRTVKVDTYLDRYLKGKEI